MNEEVKYGGREDIRASRINCYLLLLHFWLFGWMGIVGELVSPYLFTSL